MKIDKHSICIKGSTVRLRSMAIADLEHKVRWLNDPDVSKSLLIDIKLQLDSTIKWFEKISSEKSRCDLMIETPDFKPIGITGLVEIDEKHQTAEIFIVIGQTEYWGKGVMLEAESLLIQWAFSELGLYKIWAHVRPDNIASIITMKKLGFKVEGLLRKQRKIYGKRVDIIRVGLLREEFIPFRVVNSRE